MMFFALNVSTIKKDNNLIAIFIVVIFSVFYGLRGADAGVDTINYVSAYNSIDASYFSYQELIRTFVVNGITAAEPGFILYAYVSKLLGLSSNTYLILVALWGLLFVYIAYKKLSDSPLLVFSLYVLSISCISLHANVIRQGMAIGFVLLALSLVISRRNALALLCFIFAAFFHFSALLVAVFSIPQMLKFKIKYFWGAFLCLIILLVSGAFSKVLFLVLPSLFAAKLDKYFHVGFGALFTFKFFSFFIFIFTLEIIKKINIEKTIYINEIYKCYFSLFFIQLLFVGDLVASERFGLYRFAFEPIIIVLFFDSLKEKYFAKSILTILAFIYGALVFNIPMIKGILS